MPIGLPNYKRKEGIMGVDKLLSNCVSRPDGTAVCWDDETKDYRLVRFQIEAISPDKVTADEAKKLLDKMVRKP